MLPQFYLDYLKTYFPDSELLTLQILVWLLQAHRQVRIERLASRVESMEGIIPRTSQLDRSVRVSPHCAPEYL
jgi:hypothetical protein